ncbi:MAG TPA: hypothetical protein VF185_03760 [Patescibacteria group bacterium]
MSETRDLNITTNSKIKLFPLTIQPGRKGKIIIGSKRTNSFIIIDSYWEKFVEVAKKEKKVSKIAEKLRKEDPNNFIGSYSTSKVKLMFLFFAMYKLVEKIDGKTVFENKRITAIRINPKLTNILGSKPFVLVYFFLALFGLFFTVLNGFSVLDPQNFFWSGYLSVTFLTYFVFTVVMIVVHEFAHFVAARKFGLTGNFSLSNRLQFLVVESKFPNMYSITKRGRIIVFLSGTLIDLATVGVLYFFLPINPKHTNTPLAVSALIKQFLLLEWVAILWQFLFYMKTDFYFVVKEMLGIENLYTYAKKRTMSFIKRDENPVLLSKRENNIVNIYTALFVFGTIFGIWRYLTIHLPITIRFIFQSLSNLFTGVFTNNFVLSMDGFVVLIIELIFVTLFVRVITKKK